jgi:ABC-type Fe3+ transport system substrate-binding protein
MNVLRLLAPLTVLLAVSVTATSASSPADQKSTGEETKTLDQLYAEALAEGGNLLVYHGGDTAKQQDGVQAAFRAAYPKINFTMIIDYSKYHDVRVDNQIKTNSLEADIIAVQTLQNYPRWKKQGDLLCYKPAGFSQIYQPFVDKDGCWLAHAAYSFSYFYDTAQLNASGLPIPKSAKDLGNPVYANHIASSYPHDDDAALFIYHQYIEKYGWEWVAKMAAQNIQFKRGSNTPGEAVSAKQKAIGVAASGPWSVPTVVTVNGKDADSPYLVWGQRMAILKKAPHPAAAKLFLNWIVSKEVQSTTMFAISSRVDTKSPAPWDFPQASTDKFPVFMEDRAAIERLKFTLALYFGEVQGAPSPGVYGLHPRK